MDILRLLSSGVASGLRVFVLLCLPLSPCLGEPAAESAGVTLTCARAVRTLSPEEWEAGHAVQLEAVVTFSHPSVPDFFVLQDGVGLRVRSPAGGAPPAIGSVLAIHGVTESGAFGPLVRSAEGTAPFLQNIGSNEVPDPLPVDGAGLLAPGRDADWIAVEATVREVRMVQGDLVFECQTGSHGFDVILNGPLQPSSIPWYLADNRVLVHGVVDSAPNAIRQITRRFLRIASVHAIRSLDPAPNTTPDPPLVSPDSLLTYSGAGSTDYVRLRGVTTLALPGRGIFLRTGNGSLWVQMAQPLAAPPGSAVEVDGWPRSGPAKPFLRVRRAVVLGVGIPPEPIHMSADEASHVRHDAELITLEAELLATMPAPDGLILELRDAGRVFQAFVAEADGIAALHPASRLRLTGIARLGAIVPGPGGRAGSLLLHARSAADVVLLAPPPFWTPRRVAFASSVPIVLMALAAGVSLARRAHERTAQRREFEAVLNERNRFAREIHDSLAQGLTSISLQLECIREEIPGAPQSALRHVETARALVRESLREARHTVWNLRPLALGEADLASALQHFASNLTRSGKVMYSQHIEGTPRPLPPEQEAAMLRIGQEALTNATRHAQPTQITLTLRFEAEMVTLTVRDNGKGFDVAARARKGYGLIGMHERVEALGGSLSIDSRPGEGTEVSATLQS